MFQQKLSKAGHTRRFEIQEQPGAGWEAREECDSRVVRSFQYTDWHRVERRLTDFVRRIAELENQGWRPPIPTDSR